MPRRYSRRSQKSVQAAMHKFKRDRLKSGTSGKRVQSRRQAVAIGLSEARKTGARVPAPSRSRGRAVAYATSRKRGRPAKRERGARTARTIVRSLIGA